MDDSDWDSSDTEDANDYVKSCKVEGAGLEVVNGEYQRNERFDGVAMYTKTVHWQDQRHEFSLFRCNTSNGTKRWYISIVPLGVQPGTSTDIDFYSAPMDRTQRDYPPTSGWSVESEGRVPAPTVSLVRKPWLRYWRENRTMPTASILKPVASAYKEMLFREDFSDIKLICEDGVTIPAHKNILAASSPYFKAAFTGPWSRNLNGQLSTPYPSHIIKVLLTMIYTGDVNIDHTIKEEPLVFMSIGSEYELPWLKRLAEACCIRSLDESNLKDTWQAGRLFESTLLKNACVLFVRENLNVLKSGDTTSLQTEDVASWAELAEAVANTSDDG